MSEHSSSLPGGNEGGHPAVQLRGSGGRACFAPLGLLEQQMGLRAGFDWLWLAEAGWVVY